MKKTHFIILILLFSCTQTHKRTPSSVSSPLPDLIEKIYQTVESENMECSEIGEQYKNLFQINSEIANINSIKVEEIKKLINLSFNSRKHLRNLAHQEEFFISCENEIRSLNRALRYTEDYFIETYLKKLNIFKPENEYQTFEGDFPLTLGTNKHALSELKSGDIIISRGNAFTSAAIARIAEFDSQFSHVSFVYKDEKGEFHTTEAHIEIGSITAPLVTHIEQGNSRTAIMRYHDEKVAHEAAKYIFERVKKHQLTGRNIPYDFAMDYQDHSQIFCSEVAFEGFEQKGVDIPRHKSKLTQGTRTFLNKIGIPVDDETIKTFKIFSPGDLEFDPRFKMVLEWRNPAKLKHSRIKDVILTKMYEWMAQDKYEFRPGLKISMKAYLAWVMRRTPIVKKKLEIDKKFPLNMSADQLKLFLVLDDVGLIIENELFQRSSEAKDELSPKELFELTEIIRSEDHEKYINKQKPNFHKKFRYKK
jgi:hypothetical protein